MALALVVAVAVVVEVARNIEKEKWRTHFFISIGCENAALFFVRLAGNREDDRWLWKW
jgi:hypothetical protein